MKTIIAGNNNVDKNESIFKMLYDNWALCVVVIAIARSKFEPTYRTRIEVIIMSRALINIQQIATSNSRLETYEIPMQWNEITT